jgi:vacuolar protein sorting-associated protein 35
LEQEKILDDALKAVKGGAYHLKAAIERNNMRHCLRQSAALLNELRTQKLTPKSYYSLYTVCFDEMQYLYDFIKEEAKRGRRMFDLYDTVQQASAILPRLYLMITTAAVLIEDNPKAAKEKIFDLLNMVKGIQNPTRGLFTRYYLLKMIKDKLPDKGNQYESETATINDTLSFILQNLEEMNRLWIRLSAGTSSPSEKTLRERERVELKILVGENIVRLSSLDGLNLSMYQEEILPKIISILLESKDQLSQQYLMECVIHAFPDEYNIHCMQTILDTMTQVINTVDVKALLISLMDKIARYVGEQGKESEGLIEQAEKIFSQLKSSIDNLIQQGISQQASGYEPIKLIELLVALMKFTVKCCPAQDKLNTINHIFEMSLTILNNYNKKLNSESINLLRSLLSVPLESELSLFEFKKFPELMVFLDFSSRTTLAIRIIESLNNKEKLDSTEKINILLGFIRPLLEDSSDTIEVEAGQFEYEQNVVSKMLYVISTNDPEKLMEILCAITPEFLKGGNRRIKYTLPTLVHCFLNLGYQFCASYEAKNGQVPEINTGIAQEYLSYLDMSKINNEEIYEKYLAKLHSSVNQIVSILVQSYPDIAFKLWLTSSLQSNSIKISFDKFNETTLGYLNGAFAIYKESEIEPKKKLSLFNQLISTLLQLKGLPRDSLTTLVQKIQESAQNLAKRAEQCLSMQACSNLYYSLLENKEKAKECLNKAKRFADFAMTNPEHLNLFVVLLNKYIFYVDTCGENNFVSIESFEDIIETIKNHIQTIKTESSNQSFLPEIEKYFDSTMEIIKKRKEEGGIKFYQELNIN